MQKYIKITENGEMIPVSDVYAYTYDSGLGKQVLRLYIKPTTKTYDELFLLLNSGTAPTILEYWDIEDDAGQVTNQLITEHTYYCKDYKCAYNGSSDYPDEYAIEITRKSAAEIKSEQNTATVQDINLALASIYETVLS